jgi:hypothetical protein
MMLPRPSPHVFTGKVCAQRHYIHLLPILIRSRCAPSFHSSLDLLTHLAYVPSSMSLYLQSPPVHSHLEGVAIL